MSNELMKKPVRVGGPVGLAAKKKAASVAIEQAIDPRTIVTTPAAEMPERIGIVMDDSGSMHGSKITDAHEGIEEFLRCCKPTTTAVAIYPMNQPPMRLNTELPNTAIVVKKIWATGSTPLLPTLENMIDTESLTRAIVFSDGSPDTEAGFEKVVAKCKEKSIPVDTVFISGSYASEYAEQFMRKLAEATGGIFMKFEAGKGTFKGAFKYLAPVNRALLMDKSFKEKVERGEA